MTAEQEFDRREAAGKKPRCCEIDHEDRAVLRYESDDLVIGDWHQPGVIQVMAKLADRCGWGDRYELEEYLKEAREFGFPDTALLPPPFGN